MTYDAIIVGAGFAGAVAARELAERGGKRVLVLERRDHIGGNAYDCLDEHGVLIHQYGPHIFHTNDRRVADYLGRFMTLSGYQHKVVANIPKGEGRTLFPVPFNLVSLEVAFGPREAARLEKKLVDTYGAEKKVTILELRRNADTLPLMLLPPDVAKGMTVLPSRLTLSMNVFTTRGAASHHIG